MTAVPAEPPPGPDWTAGLDLIEHRARTGQPFSANELRPALQALGFGRHSTGMLFLQAQQHGVIREAGLVRSQSRPTNGKRLSQWIGARP